jgi:hypothetical protein
MELSNEPYGQEYRNRAPSQNQNYPELFEHSGKFQVNSTGGQGRSAECWDQMTIDREVRKCPRYNSEIAIAVVAGR